MVYEEVECLLMLLMMTIIYFYIEHSSIPRALYGMIIVDKYYPKYYRTPKSWMKKFYKFKNRSIPVTTYYECFTAFWPILMALVIIILSFIFDLRAICLILFWIPFSIMMVSATIHGISTYIFELHNKRYNT